MRLEGGGSTHRKSGLEIPAPYLGEKMEEGEGRKFVSTKPEERTSAWASFGARKYPRNSVNERDLSAIPMGQFEADYMERREREKHAGMFERMFAPDTRQTIIEGHNDPIKYESFTISKIEHSDDDVIWICFPGLGSAYQESDMKKILGTTTIAERAKDAAARFLGVPGVLDSLPKEGTAFVFNGPAGIAGYTPEQCIRATLAVKEAVDHIIAQYPNKKIKIFSYSAGTHLGYYTANQIGKERGRPVDEFIAVSPGISIAYGMFSTWVVEYLAQYLERTGMTKYEYHKLIAEFTQINNLEYLPVGDKHKVYAGVNDGFVPIDMEGGTNDLIKAADAAGKSPTYVVYENRDHVSIMMDIIVAMQRGLDPYYLKQKINAWENPGTLQDTTYMGLANEFLSNFTDEQMRGVADVLAERNGEKGVGPSEADELLRPHERAVVKLLMDRGLCAFETRSASATGGYQGEPVILTVTGRRDKEGSSNFMERREEKRAKLRDFAQISAYMLALGRSEDVLEEFGDGAKSKAA
ncbi:MAG: hypothetical protein NUV59_04265 [Patescibacteria group bacterium]|nr:hypothetical protein [Patescibacteria group bacterium]